VGHIIGGSATEKRKGDTLAALKEMSEKFDSLKRDFEGI
jgi:hypothetical protein